MTTRNSWGASLPPPPPPPVPLIGGVAAAPDDQPLDPAPDISSTAEIWKMYVQKADEHDRALFERWRESVDVFLLFVRPLSIR